MSPRSATKNQEIRQLAMQRILNAAFVLIARQGYEATSIAQIAKEAGVSKGLLYNYFESKEDLLRQMVDQAMSEGDQIVARAMSTDPVETLENLFTWFFGELRSRPAYWRIFTELTMKIDKFAFVHEIGVEKLAGYTRLLEDLFTRMGIEDPVGEAKIVAALFDGIAVQSVVIREAYPLDQFEEILKNRYCKKKR